MVQLIFPLKKKKVEESGGKNKGYWVEEWNVSLVVRPVT